MKFDKKKEDGLNGTQVSFRPEGDEDFSLRATKSGVQFIGRSPTFSSMEDLKVLAATVDKAWREHLSLKPVIEKVNLLGH